MSDDNRENVWITPAMGMRIRLAREAKGLSQGQLAQKINAAQQQIAHYETGDHPMAMQRLFDLARVLDVPVADFFDA